MHHSDNVDSGLEKLNNLLPLQNRLAGATDQETSLYRDILYGFLDNGRAPSISELSQASPELDVATILEKLADLDLIVLDKGAEVAGAYPFTNEERDHRLKVKGKDMFAMCALDALSLAPMFGVTREISSVCAMTGKPITISMDGNRVLTVSPENIHVGIRWQSTCGCAAANLCTEMVFLADAIIAEQWQQQDAENISLYTLQEAVEFGDRFFSPLVSHRH